MKVTLSNSENNKIKRKLGFSLKFFTFGSLLYLFNRKIFKFSLFLLFYFVTLVWLLNPAEIFKYIFDPITRFLDWGVIGKLNLNKYFTEFIIFYVKNFKNFFYIKSYSVNLYAVVGLSIFLLVRLFIAMRYNKRKIRKLFKQGYNAYSETDVQALKQYKVISGKKAMKQSRTSNTFNYNRNPSSISINAKEAQKKSDLELLNNAYASGMLSKEVYIQKRNEIERR